MKLSHAPAGTIVAAVAAVGFLGTAALHSTGYGTVVELAAEVPSDLAPVIPALWLAFSLDLAVVGLIVAVVAWRQPRGSPAILLLAALQPLGAAILQLTSIGFVPPTAILLILALITIIAAAAVRSRPSAMR
ncbi:MAG: hypothetical protein OER90_01400 [Gemmatimonadota bacterium]|nr:hypothetical protein [Gemmatimonadota bacterium]